MLYSFGHFPEVLTAGRHHTSQTNITNSVRDHTNEVECYTLSISGPSAKDVDNHIEEIIVMLRGCVYMVSLGILMNFLVFHSSYFVVHPLHPQVAGIRKTTSKVWIRHVIFGSILAGSRVLSRFALDWDPQFYLHLRPPLDFHHDTLQRLIHCRKTARDVN